MKYRAKALVDRFVTVCSWIAIAAMVVIVVLIAAHVIARLFFHAPIRGVIDITEVAMGVLGGFALFNTTYKRGHILVSMITSKFAQPVQAVLYPCINLISAGMFGLIGYEILLSGLTALETDAVTNLISIPLGPIKILFGAGFLLAGATFLAHVFTRVGADRETEVGDEVGIT